MSRLFYVIIFSLSGIFFIISSVAFSIYFSWKYNLENQVESISFIAKNILQRSDQVFYQAQSISQELIKFKKNNACEFENIELMKKLDLKSDRVQVVGYVKNNIFICSSHGIQNIDLGEPTYIAPYGIEVRTSFEFPFLPKTKFLLLTNKSTGFTVAIHENAILGILNNNLNVSQGLYSISSKKIIVGRGFFKEEWMNHINEQYQVQFVDDESFVLMLKSNDLDNVAFAAMPIKKFNKGLYNILIILIPIGVFSGGGMVLAFIKLTRQHLSMPSLIKRALKKNEFFMLYQPVIDLKTGLWVGAEALVRWRRPSGEIVPSDIFIDAAEESHIISEITSKVIKMVALDAKNFFKAHPNFHLAINLSASDISSKEIVGELKNLLIETGAADGNFLVEITERGFVKDDFAKIILQEIRNIGIDVAIDDFGTGYSSLSYLEKFEIDYLKIDKSFVDTLGKYSVTSQVAPHIIEIAKSLNLKMIAEGVEEEYQSIYLRDHGVHFAQGWLYSKPIKFHELKRMMEYKSIDCKSDNN